MSTYLYPGNTSVTFTKARDEVQNTQIRMLDYTRNYVALLYTWLCVYMYIFDHTRLALFRCSSPSFTPFFPLARPLHHSLFASLPSLFGSLLFSFSWLMSVRRSPKPLTPIHYHHHSLRLFLYRCVFTCVYSTEWIFSVQITSDSIFTAMLSQKL